MFVTLLAALGGVSRQAQAQLSTEDHLAEPGFWPTQSHAAQDGYVGTGACARCHGAMVASQRLTPMAQTAMHADAAAILHAHPELGFSAAGYTYRIDTPPGKAGTYSIASKSTGESLAYPLTWAFGTGRVGQSYLFKKDDGRFYEARVTWFESLGTLGFTPARALRSPSGIDEAMYRRVPEAEVLRCFGCHTTGSNVDGVFDERHLVPGVTCEACHGPGAAHIAAMDAMNAGSHSITKAAIFNSGNLGPTDAVEFCGACHGSLWDVKLAGVKGVSSARSAPYRLVTSKCWGTRGDARLTCTACHDPHQQLETRAAAYDHACLQCHVNRLSAKPAALPKPTTDHPGAACPVATGQCTRCHMPKVYVPEMNDNFTDHRIRIAQAGEAYPE